MKSIYQANNSLMKMAPEFNSQASRPYYSQSYTYKKTMSNDTFAIEKAAVLFSTDNTKK